MRQAKLRFADPAKQPINALTIGCGSYIHLRLLTEILHSLDACLHHARRDSHKYRIHNIQQAVRELLLRRDLHDHNQRKMRRGLELQRRIKGDN